MRKNYSLFLMLILILIFLPNNSYSEKIEIIELNDIGKNGEIDLVKNHTLISENIEAMKKSKKYLFPELLVIKNPYNINTTGLYIYFETLNPSYIEYEIDTIDSNRNKISKKLYNEQEFTNIHEYQIVGIVPGEKNKISITVVDNKGVRRSISFIYDAPDIYSKSYQGVYVKKGDSKFNPIDGFYVLPTREGYSLLLDDYGNIRGELSTRFIQFKIKDRYLYTINNNNEILKINHLGRIEKNYKTDKFSYHHDFTIFDDDLLVLATNNKISTIENRINDSIVKIDINNGEIEEIIDFNTLLPELYNISKGVVSHNVLSGKGKRDVIHPNTIDVDRDGNILISSRETSSIIKINMIEGVPKLGYIISSPEVWENIGGYSEKIFNKIGISKHFSGQHSTYIKEDKNLEEGQYYISIFDNNSAIMESRPNFAWNSFKDSYIVPKKIDKNTFVPNNVYSYFLKYLVDENEKTYKLVDSFKLPFSFFQSSVQDIENHIIYNSSFKGEFGEYDINRDLVRSFVLANNTHPYRVEKIIFKDYWFK